VSPLLPIKVVPLKYSTLAIPSSASAALTASKKTAGAVQTAPLAGLVNAMVGIAFEMTVTGVEVVVTPRLSVAFAVILYVPAATPTQLYVYGDEVIVESNVAPLKNSTLAIVPSLSTAAAIRFMVAGAEKIAPELGAVMDTVGAAFEMSVIGAEVAAAPRVSVTLAVIDG
jgi:hypothetical protein